MKNGLNSQAQTKNTDPGDGVRCSFKNDNNGKRYWYIETQKDIFKGLKTNREVEKAAFNYIIGLRDSKVVLDAIDGKKCNSFELVQRNSLIAKKASS